MTDIATWTLQVRVEGLAMWIRRDTHIEVLFPDDRLRISNDEHHFVTLHRGGADLGEGGQPVQNATLDFTGLSLTAYPTPVIPSTGAVPLMVEPRSVADASDAVTKGTGLVAALRLPYGKLESLGSEHGPFVFGDHKNLQLSYGLSWKGTLSGTHALKIESIAHGPSGAVTPVQLPGGPAHSDRTVTIRCLSRRDRRGKDELTKGDPLTEVAFLGHITTASGQPLPDVPRYEPTVQPMVTPKKPCPSAFSTTF